MAEDIRSLFGLPSSRPALPIELALGRAVSAGIRANTHLAAALIAPPAVAATLFEAVVSEILAAAAAYGEAGQIAGRLDASVTATLQGAYASREGR